jgi:SOS response regulatory protein OraA/RecX
VPTITALRERPRERIEVELDGAPWRTLPTDAVVRAQLAVGLPLDRSLARTLARELRRAKALHVAVRALRHRDLSRRALAERLPRPAREEAVAVLERSGLLDDGRTAAARARALAGRGWADEAIRYRLGLEGFDPDASAAALAALPPEAERADALRARGRSDRWLAARGFAPDP